MSDPQKTLIAFALKILGGILLAGLLWGAGRYDASKLDAGRFIADSARREQRYTGDHDILLRIDRRLSDIYCGKLAPDLRPGCQ